MKRRSFFGILAGLCAVPVAAVLPKAAPGQLNTADEVMAYAHGVLDAQGRLMPEGIDWREILEQRRQEMAMLRKLDLDPKEMGDAIAACMIVAAVEEPLTDRQIRWLFR